MRSCESCTQFVYDDKGQVAQTPEGRGHDGQPIMVPARRPKKTPPPCGICPKWESRERDAKPLTGVEDLFALTWFHDCREQFLEGRAVGDFGTPDPFTRSVYSEIDQCERRIERQATSGSLAAVARLMSRR